MDVLHKDVEVVSTEPASCAADTTWETLAQAEATSASEPFARQISIRGQIPTAAKLLVRWSPNQWQSCASSASTYPFFVAKLRGRGHRRDPSSELVPNIKFSCGPSWGETVPIDGTGT